jgi:hypothetical protein
MSWYCEVNPDHNDCFNECLICEIVELQKELNIYKEAIEEITTAKSWDDYKFRRIAEAAVIKAGKK